MQSFFLLFVVVTIHAAEPWQNTETTTVLWRMISTKSNVELSSLVATNRDVVKLRSEDGRGALWWAWEYENAEALALFKVYGFDIYGDDKDANGQTAEELCEDRARVDALVRELVPVWEERKKAMEAAMEEQKNAAREADDPEIEDDLDEDSEEDETEDTDWTFDDDEGATDDGWDDGDESSF